MTDAPQAALLLETLQNLGATHLVGLPDNGSAALFAQAEENDGIELLTVSREGEAFAVASGLWLGGKEPVVVVQNTGLLESGDSIRGTATRMGAPIMMLVGVRGYDKMQTHHRQIEADRAVGSATQTLKRAEVDSVALLTEATLDAWRIPHAVYGAKDDGAVVETMWQRARDGGHPVAILLPHGLR